jgi:uncharacterized protein YciI
MRYFVVAFDYRDPECLERRMTHRSAHLEMVEQLHTRGQLLFGGAILDDKGNMIGSGQIVDFPDKESTCVEDTRAPSSLQPSFFDKAIYSQVPPV